MNITEFKWLNKSSAKQTDGRIEIIVPAQTDFFCGSIDECEERTLHESLCNALYYYTKLEGHFVLKVKVSHGFKGTYDSASVMVMKDRSARRNVVLSIEKRTVKTYLQANNP